MLILGTFRDLRTVLVLGEKVGYIVQKENFKNSSYLCRYSITQGFIGKSEMEQLIEANKDSSTFEVLEDIVYKNEHWAGSETGTRKQLLEEHPNDENLRKALDLFSRKAEFEIFP